MSTLYVEDLLRVDILDPQGRKVGRIHEIVAEERDGKLEIVEYHLGSGAILERVSASLRGMFGLKQKEPVRIHWDRLDLSDLSRPTLKAVGQSGSQAV